MRIIAGSFRSRRLAIPPTTLTRPTSDRTREAVFNVLQTMLNLKGIQVLDAFAGSGAMGLEALSRGATHSTFIENHPQVCKVLQQNIQTLNVKDQTIMIHSDATQPPQAKAPVELIFLDPPYHKDLEVPSLTALTKQGWLKAGTIVVIEIAKKSAMPTLEPFDQIDQRVYGAAQIVFLKFRKRSGNPQTIEPTKF